MLARPVGNAPEASVLGIAPWRGGFVAITRAREVVAWAAGRWGAPLPLSGLAVRVCAAGETVVAVSSAGEAWLIAAGADNADGPVDLTILCTFDVISNVSEVAIWNGRLAVGSWDGVLAVYALAGLTTNASPHAIIETTGKVTALAASPGMLAVACEASVCVIDTALKRIASKRLGCCATVLALSSSGVFIGLINGRVHFEHFNDPDESFIFNAHCEATADEKVFYPVTAMCVAPAEAGPSEGSPELFTAGFNGRVIRWDTAGKRSKGSVLSASGAVTRFFTCNGHVYALQERNAPTTAVTSTSCTDSGYTHEPFGVVLQSAYNEAL